jgi:CRISPR-associated protein Csc2
LEYHDGDSNLVESIGEYVTDVRRSDWEIYGNFEGAYDVPDWFMRLYEVAARDADDADDVLREEFLDLTEDAKDELLGND